MGRIVIIMVFLLLIIFGTIMVSLNQKQVSSAEHITEETWKVKAHHLANAFAEQAIKELMDFIKNESDALPSYVDYDHSNYIENSFINVSVDKIPYESDEYSGYDYHIISIADIHASDGGLYRGHTEVIYTNAASYTSSHNLEDISDIDGEDPNDYPQATDGVLYASKKSDVYHFPTCRYIKTIKKVNLTTFANEAEAVGKNYRQCKVCHELIIHPPIIIPGAPAEPPAHPTKYIKGIRVWDERPVEVLWE